MILKNTVKRESDFNKIFSKGKRVYSKSLTMIFVKGDKLKIGYSVSKKHGHAVLRNRIKRLLRAATREAFRNMENAPRLYIVFLPKIREEYLYADFLRDMNAVLKREGLK